MNKNILWAYGFRPFFLAAALYGGGFVVLWVALLLLGRVPEVFSNPSAWHAHEMIFGFVGAALAGFILTATPSWTDTPAVEGRPLQGLFILWLAGRMAMLFADYLPDFLVVSINLPFLPVLAFWIGRSMVRGRSTRHLSFLWAILLLWLTQGVMFSGWLLEMDRLIEAGQNAALVLLMILIILAITRISMVVVNHALEEQGDDRMFLPRPPRRNLAIAALAVYGVADLIVPGHPAVGWLAFAAAFAQLDCLADFHMGRVLVKPYVAALYATHLWIAIGLAGLGLDILSDYDVGGAARHALGIGAVGTAILGVLTIAGLRHTGHELIFPKRAVAAIVCLSLSGILRVFAPLIYPDGYVSLGIEAATVFWVGGFAFYLWAFWPKLTTPRVDGQPG